jgi:hypothetical protein
MILMGSSASAATLTDYLQAHMVYRMPDMKPIFDGFFPTSIGGEAPIRKVDVPLILMPTMTEVNAAAGTGNPYRRFDGDAPGDQFRIYEVAGMAHIDSRSNPIYEPDPCRYPVSRFPAGAMLALGLDHLVQWVDKGRAPPRADYIAVDRNPQNDGSLLALDANGNVKGGVRNTYVDVPLHKYAVPNEGSPIPVPNASATVTGFGVNGAQVFCGIAGSQMPLTGEQVKTLYRNKEDYRRKVEQRLAQLTKTGWFLPLYTNIVLQDAEQATLP